MRGQQRYVQDFQNSACKHQMNALTIFDLSFWLGYGEKVPVAAVWFAPFPVLQQLVRSLPFLFWTQKACSLGLELNLSLYTGPVKYFISICDVQLYINIVIYTIYIIILNLDIGCFELWNSQLRHSSIKNEKGSCQAACRMSQMQFVLKKYILIRYVHVSLYV